MSDLEFGVRIKADATGLVGQVGQGKTALDGFANSAAGVNTRLLAMSNGFNATNLRSAADALKSLRAGQLAVIDSTDQMTRADRNASAAKRMLGIQFNDFFTQVGSGSSITQAFAMQVGQMGFAASQMGGKVGAVGSFLAGPWGGLIAIGASFLGTFIGKLFESGDAADAAKNKVTDFAAASDTLGAAQSLLSRFLDLTTGKITSQNVVVREAIILQTRLAEIEAVRAGQEAGARLQALRTTRSTRVEQSFRDDERGGVRYVETDQSRAAAASFRQLVRNFTGNGNANITEFRRNLEGMAAAGQLPGVDINEAMREAVTIATNRQQIRDVRAVRGVADGSIPLPDYLRRPASSSRGTKPRGRDGAAAASRLDEFGDDAASRIADLTGQFADAPRQAEAVRKALASLDDLLEDIQERRPPDLEQLLAQAGAARAVIEAGINKPFRDFIDGQNEALAVQRLQIQGRFAEADALKVIQGLEAQMGVAARAHYEAILASVEQLRDGRMAAQLADYIRGQREGLEVQGLALQGRTEEARALEVINQLQREGGRLSGLQREAILLSVQAMRAQQREAEILEARQRGYIDSLADTRGLINDTLTGLATGDIGAIAALPERLMDAFGQLVADTLTERLFGDAFRELQDQIDGTVIVRDAAEQLRATVEQMEREGATFTDTTGAATDALRSLEAAGTAVAGIFRDIAGTPAADPWGGGLGVAGGGMPTDARRGPDDLAFDFIDALSTGNVQNILANLITGSLAMATAGQIIVNGQRLGDAAAAPAQTSAADPRAGLPGFPNDPSAFFANMLSELLEDAFGPRFAKLVGTTVTRGLEGAAYGSLVGGILRSAGVETDKTGAALGGAIGNIAGEALTGTLTEMFGKTIGQFAGPLGSIAGSIIGGLLGSAISGPNKASATISSVDGPLSVTGKSGMRGAANSLGEAVQQGIGRIAEALGGQLGAFSVSIGKRGESFRVDPQGRGQTKAPGVLAFDTEEAAVAAAILDAIKDGAVTGLSAAMQQALRSSTDIDKAVREALKVREVEELLSGVAGELNSFFREFEGQAAERVRIARQYGFDVAKIEELNAKERAELIEKALAGRVGRLQDLLDDLNFGSLFEGSIVDRREKLVAELATEKQRALAGEDGAADRVAELSRQLIDLTRSGFGTAGGEFAADRASTIATANDIIRAENERVKQAQDAAIGTDQKMAEANRLANEGNGMMAELLAIFRGGAGAASIGGAGGSVAGIAPSTGRQVEL